MNESRTARRRRERTLRRNGGRPWSEAPHLWPVVATTLFGAFAGGPKIRTCAHLDGLGDLADLDRVALWSPAIIRSLVCADCYEHVMAELQATPNTTGLRCDACDTVTTALVSFTTGFERPNSLLHVIGIFCTNCAPSPGDAA